MRIYLLPISTRRTLLYAQRLPTSPSSGLAKASLADRGVALAARTWAQWERKESGWQRRVVELGNHAFRRIPYEEWGLKSVPPLTPRQRDREVVGRASRPTSRGGARHDTEITYKEDENDDADEPRVELLFPPSSIPERKATDVLRALGTERQALHRKRLLWCFAAMPATVPFVLVPIIPNLPFFYLVYRAWSHWRALLGGRHIQWLLEHDLLSPTPSPVLDRLYSPRVVAMTAAETDGTDGTERMLLTRDQVRSFSETLDIPALEIELERAVWQVEQSLMTKEKMAQANAEGPEHSGRTTQEPDRKPKDGKSS